MKINLKYFLFYLIFLCGNYLAQNEATKWYFGNYAGLDFSTNPPTAITGTLSSLEGCASIADPAGNLLFYTNSMEVYNKSHVIMANGTGLFGDISSTQNSIIVKHPGNSNIYFLFTLSSTDVNSTSPFPGTLFYSVIEMSLAAGMGSVTVKNVFLADSLTEKMTGVKHCNGVDVWVLVHDSYSKNSFRSFQINTSGVNPSPVISFAGLPIPASATYGAMKLSPNGKKLAVTTYSAGNNELFDFNNSTGIVSNPLLLATPPGQFAYGVEFSPDGSKVYMNASFSASIFGEIYQWDLCAGTPLAIQSSSFIINSSQGGALQLGPDGKIYGVGGSSPLGVINNPNVAGIGCNYNNAGPTLIGGATFGLPNFLANYLSPPFTYTASNTPGCQTVSFTAQTYTIANCSSSGSNPSSLLWNFGDPLSGAANTSTLTDPIHTYTVAGQYTAKLIYYYGCGGTDTIRQQITITGPTVSIISSSISCASLGSATVIAGGLPGPFTYTWLPGGQIGSVVTNLSPGHFSVMVSLVNGYCVSTTTTDLLSSNIFAGLVNSTPVLKCHGANTGSASVTNFTGGSGNQSYSWYNGTNTYTSISPQNLIAGQWTVTVTDVLTHCELTRTFVIAEPPPLQLNFTSTNSVCINDLLTLSGINSGGTPPYTYSWTAGPQTSTFTITNALSGTHTYTLKSNDANLCSVSATTAVHFIPTPTLSIANITICPFSTGALNATGATSYTWNNGTNSATFTYAPISTNSYSVIGSALGCTASAQATIYLRTSPIAIINTNTSSCTNQNLYLSGTGGNTYHWRGPLNFNSDLQNPTLNITTPAQSGTYTLIVIDSESCAGSSTVDILMHNPPGGDLLGSQMKGCIPFHSDFFSVADSSIITTQWALEDSLFPGKTFSYDFYSAGDYLITGKYTDKITQCTNTQTFVVNAYSPPVSDFSYYPEKPIENSDPVFFKNSSKGENQTNWTWFFINNSGYKSTGESTSYFFTDAGIYPVVLIVKNFWGCSDTIIKTIKVETDFSIYVPNAFTPNGDQLNDVFLPILNSVKFYNLSIFNRWGTEIFKTSEVSQGWDGIYNGEESKNDMYVWKINVSTTHGEMKEFTGHVILNR